MYSKFMIVRGNQVFESTNFQPNDLIRGWNGTSKVKMQPEYMFTGEK